MKSKVAVILLATVAIGVGIAYATGLFSEDSQLTEVRELQKEIQNDFANAQDGDQASREQRRAKFQELRKKTEALPEDQKQGIRKQMQNYFVARMSQRLDEFFELSREEQDAHLDERIDGMEQRRAEREEAREKERADREAQSGQDAKTEAAPADGQSSAGDGKGRRGRWSNMPKEERDRWRRDMLDVTTPAQRAKFMEYRRRLNERRKERGLPPSRGFGR